MPAFSVTTLKLIARSILTIANRAAFASSQPTTRIAIASSTRGRNSPTCAQRRPQRLEQHFHVFHRLLQL